MVRCCKRKKRRKKPDNAIKTFLAIDVFMFLAACTYYLKNKIKPDFVSIVKIISPLGLRPLV
jgi:outer membrane lipopolysaccharide assembly protein LptE/RlpB